jgi:hypothetical protein
MIPLFGLSLIFSIALCVHVVRSGQAMYWLFIILMFQPLGGIVYLLAIVAPEFMGGTKAQQMKAAARQALDPQREYREASRDAEDAPTVTNLSRLAAAATSLGKHEEAERIYAQALQGHYADDPALMLARANSLIELGRAAEALPLLEALGEQGVKSRTPQTALALGRAQAALGRTEEADVSLRWAAAHLPGFEGMARYAVFLGETGRKAEAREALAELDKRLSKTHPKFRKEAKGWREMAAAAAG